MSDYDAEIARQSSRPFNPQERKTIRRVTEHWIDRRRYSEERKRRIASYGWWVGFAVPIIVSIYKLIEAFLGK